MKMPTGFARLGYEHGADASSVHQIERRLNGLVRQRHTGVGVMSRRTVRVTKRGDATVFIGDAALTARGPLPTLRKKYHGSSPPHRGHLHASSCLADPPGPPLSGPSRPTRRSPGPVTLEQILDGQSMIFTAKVVEFLPDKPGMVLAPVDKLKGEVPVRSHSGQSDRRQRGEREKELDKLLERFDKELFWWFSPISWRCNSNLIAYTNGTWLRLNGPR